MKELWLKRSKHALEIRDSLGAAIGNISDTSVTEGGDPLVDGCKEMMNLAVPSPS